MEINIFLYLFICFAVGVFAGRLGALFGIVATILVGVLTYVMMDNGFLTITM